MSAPVWRSHLGLRLHQPSTRLIPCLLLIVMCTDLVIDCSAYRVRPKGVPSAATSYVYHRSWDRGDNPGYYSYFTEGSGNRLVVDSGPRPSTVPLTPRRTFAQPVGSETLATSFVVNGTALTTDRRTPRISGRRLLELLFFSRKDECRTSGGLYGTCLTNLECVRRKGFPDGTCSDGLGACCVFLIRCNEMVEQNGTFFVNRNYPNEDLQPDVCQVTIQRPENVCQLRFDFVVFKLKGPDSGTCMNDRFLVSGLDPSKAIPPLCGINDNQHVYVDCRDSQPTLTLNVLLLNKGHRVWVIKITTIPCNSPMKAPDSCLQYHIGPSGSVTSFNYDFHGKIGGQYYNNLDYAICLRKEAGHCSVTYKNWDVFQIWNVGAHKYGYSSSSLTTAKGAAGAGIFQCPDDYIVLTGGLRLCGEKLNDGTVVASARVNGPITESSSGPWIVRFFTNNGFVGRGWKLHYVQNSCRGIHY